MNHQFSIEQVNLCDPAQEPSDEALVMVMQFVAEDAEKSNKATAKALHAELSLEIGKTLGK